MGAHLSRVLVNIQFLGRWALHNLTWKQFVKAANPGYISTTTSAAARMLGTNEMGIPYFQPANIPDLMKAYDKYQASFGQPLPLGIKSAMAIITCMDARLMPATMFGLGLGDCEFIRNAGGRVTDDVIRSLIVTNELLGIRLILVIHHTDCGAQAAFQHHEKLAEKVKAKYGQDLPPMLGFPPTAEGLRAGIVEDVEKLKASPFIDPQIPIYGFLYDVLDASLIEVARRLPA